MVVTYYHGFFNPFSWLLINLIFSWKIRVSWEWELDLILSWFLIYVGQKR